MIWRSRLAGNARKLHRQRRADLHRHPLTPCAAAEKMCHPGGKDRQRHHAQRDRAFLAEPDIKNQPHATLGASAPVHVHAHDHKSGNAEKRHKPEKMLRAKFVQPEQAMTKHRRHHTDDSADRHRQHAVAGVTLHQLPQRSPLKFFQRAAAASGVSLKRSRAAHERAPEARAKFFHLNKPPPFKLFPFYHGLNPATSVPMALHR